MTNTHVQTNRGELPAPRLMRIMVVDDNVDAADSFSMLLQIIGHETRVEHSGSAALAAVERWVPDVVFLDIGLPGMNGYEVLNRLRERSALSGTAVVAITGWGSPEDRRRAEAAGFAAHLTKPADMTDVERLLASLAAGHEAAR